MVSMDDVPLLGEKARMLIECYYRIKRATDRAVVDDLVTTINTLTIPRSYTFVDHAGQIHVVMIENASMMKRFEDWGRLSLPTRLMHSADVVWRFNPQSGIWNVVKDRTGVYESLCPMKCGGIPVSVQRGPKP